MKQVECLKKRVQKHTCYCEYDPDDCYGKRTKRKMAGEEEKQWMCEGHWKMLLDSWFCDGGLKLCPECNGGCRK